MVMVSGKATRQVYVNPVNNNRCRRNLNLAQVRAFYPDPTDYSGQTRLALRIKASGQLQGSLEDFRSTVSARCSVWNGTAWVLQSTSNPAWWFLHLARGRVVGGKLLYGGGLPDSQIDIENIKEWAVFCAAKSLNINFVFTNQSLGAALKIICTIGRASMTRASGKLGVVWDAANLPVVQRFGMANIIAGSFSVDYATGGLPDEVVMQYTNPELNWQSDTVRITKPNTSPVVRSISFNLEGCTSREQAGREAALLAAKQYYQVRHISFDVELEALTVRAGDVIEVSHDLTQWGYSGRLVAVAGTQNNPVLTLDRTIPVASGEAIWIGLRYPENAYKIVQAVTPTVSGELDQFTLMSPLPTADGAASIVPPTTETAHDFLWIADFKATPAKRFKVMQISPKSETQVSIRAADDEPDYYASETRPYDYVTPPITTRLQPRIIGAAVVVEEVLPQVNNEMALSVSWASANASFYTILITNQTGVVLINKDTESRAITVPGGAWGGDVLTIKITPRTLGASGAALIQNHTMVGNLPPPDVANLSASITESGVVLSWDKCEEKDWGYTDIKIGADYLTASESVKVKSTEFTVGYLAAGQHTFWASHFDTAQNPSVYPKKITVTIRPPNTPTITRKDMSANVLAMAWDNAKTDQPILRYEYRYGKAGTAYADAIHYGAGGSDGLSDLMRFPSAGEKIVYVVAIDVAGNASAPAAFNILSKLPDDFILSNSWDESWDNSETQNGIILGGGMGQIVMPYAADRTWGQRLSNYGFANAAEKVAAGYPIVIQPTPLTASHTEEHDLGKVVQSAQIIITPTYTMIAGAPNQTHVQVFYRAALADAWDTAGVDINAFTVANVRFVKVVFSVESDGHAVVSLDNIAVEVKTAEVSEFARITCVAGDTDGTVYYPTKKFIDIRSAVGTAISPNISKIFGIPDDSGPTPVVRWLAYDNNNTRVSGEISINLGGF